MKAELLLIASGLGGLAIVVFRAIASRRTLVQGRLVDIAEKMAATYEQISKKTAEEFKKIEALEIQLNKEINRLGGNEKNADTRNQARALLLISKDMQQSPTTLQAIKTGSVDYARAFKDWRSVPQ